MPQRTTATPLIGIQHRANIQPLTEDQIRFEIDMCIGCDRCMRACPVPMSSQVMIADLNRANTSDLISPQIARFTEECVMCGSCVPVCPVDNHRDLLMLSLKQRLGVSWDGDVNLERALDHLPAGWDVATLIAHLREQEVFADPTEVIDNYLLHFVATSKILSLVPGETLTREGTYGRSIYFILDGRLGLSNAGPDGQDLSVAVLRAGEYLGERGMFTGLPYDTTARALTNAIVLEAPEQVMQRLMEIVPAARQYFERLHDANAIAEAFQRLNLLQGISAPDIQWLAQQSVIEAYDRDAHIFGEHAQNNTQPARESIHLVLEGFVKVARRTTAGAGRAKTDERIIAYRQQGDYFVGGLDLLGDGGAVTVSAITRVRLAQTPQAAVMTLLNRYPATRQRFQERLLQYQQSAAAAETQRVSLTQLAEAAQQRLAQPAVATTTADDRRANEAAARQGLRSLVGNGVIEGTEVLVIDLDKCVHCNNCEEACELRHGHSRMNRKGMVVGNISIATACRQCQDPVCMLCSRAGIARLPSGEVYITESCIGCGICAERCPYDNISIMSLDEENHATAEDEPLWRRFSAMLAKGFGQERGRRTLPRASPRATAGPLAEDATDPVGEMRKKVAIKCDLCAGYENQACVQACPTGAAFRTQPVQFFGSTEDILRRRAL